MRDNRGEREVIYFASEPRCILDIPLTMTSLKSYVEGLRYLDEELLRQPSCLLLTGLALLLFLSPSLFISLHLPLCAHLIRSVSSLLRSSAPLLFSYPAFLLICSSFLLPFLCAHLIASVSLLIKPLVPQRLSAHAEVREITLTLPLQI